jgi:uncharacterized protein YifE (UPF0438 family)
MSDSFSATNRFFDPKNYPRGFSRHGDLTIKEADLLERYGNAFKELDEGKRNPVNEEEVKFVAVCRGECEAETELEKVWLKYLKHINKPKRFHTLSGGKPQMEEDFPESDD